MFERNELALKLVCGAVVALVLYRLGLAIVHINPLYHVTIPALPALTLDSTNEPVKAATNSTAASTKTTTNGATAKIATGGTNASRAITNTIAQSTNVMTGTINLAQATNTSSRFTNEVVVNTNGTTHVTNAAAQSTNSGIRLADGKSGTNSLPTGDTKLMGMPPGMPARGMPGMPLGGFPGMPPGMPGMPKPAKPLPPEIQTRIDRVIDSEILAPVMRPMPMALLGIAGQSVFLRAPNGQTGLIKEGEELGGVKLVRIGINRVLVEQQGDQKELTIFAGLGSEPLVSTKKENPK